MHAYYWSTLESKVSAATGFNYFVRIPTPVLQVRFSDNYLELRDGDVAEIIARGLTENVSNDQLRSVSGFSSR